jgi:hypothetical protein
MHTKQNVFEQMLEYFAPTWVIIKHSESAYDMYPLSEWRKRGYYGRLNFFSRSQLKAQQHFDSLS